LLGYDGRGYDEEDGSVGSDRHCDQSTHSNLSNLSVTHLATHEEEFSGGHHLYLM
jgi:hypothetical protein